jgi:hypothetical protein
MSCLSIIPNGGARKACLLDQPTNLIFLKRGTKLTNYVDAQNVETWRALIQDTLLAYPTLDIRNATPTRPAPAKDTGGDGGQVTTRLDPGMVVVNLKTNACDFKEMILKMKGANYDVCIGLGVDKIMMLEDWNGELGGFDGQITAIPISMPSKDAKLEEFQLDINWDNVAQWDKYRIVQLPIYLKELVELVPLGLDVQVKTKLAASTAVVRITQRCLGDAESETLTWVETRSSESGITVVPVAGDGGEYTCTVEKAVAAALEAGDYVEGYFIKKTLDVHDKISNEVLFRL